MPGDNSDFEDLGIPVRRAGLRSYMVGPDEHGAHTKLYFNYNQDGGPLFIVQVDPETGEARQFGAPPGNPGAHGFIVGPDKKVYLGTWGGGHILCFDPADPGKGIYLVGKPSETETYIWSFTIGTDGKLYGGTYGNCKLVSYDPATGQLADLGCMDPEQQYSMCVASGQDEWVYVSVGTVRANIVAYNTLSGEKRGLFSPEMRTSVAAEVFTGVDGRAYGRHGERCFLLEGGAMTEIEPDACPEKHRDGLADGRILEHADLRGDYTLLNPADGSRERKSYSYAGDGSSIFVLGEGPGGRIYGSTAMPLEMFWYDPATGEVENPGNPTTVHGEIYSFAVWRDMLFLCAYPGGYLSSYDPDELWDFGETPGSNPRGYGPLGEGHLRPRAMIVGPDDKLYIGSHPPYGEWGGAMAVWDPGTERLVANYRNIVQDQSITALAYDPQSGLVFGGSSIVAGGGAAPKATECRIFAWDPVATEKTLEMTPVSGDRAVSSMCVADGKLFVITVPSATLSVLDIRGGALAHQKTLEMGPPVEISLGIHSDGLVYGLTGDCIFSVNPQTYAVSQVARTPVPVKCGWAMNETGIYFGSGVRLWRYRW